VLVAVTGRKKPDSCGFEKHTWATTEGEENQFPFRRERREVRLKREKKEKTGERIKSGRGENKLLEKRKKKKQDQDYLRPRKKKKSG